MNIKQRNIISKNYCFSFLLRNEVGGIFVNSFTLLFLLGLITYLAPNYTLGLLSDFLIVETDVKKASAIVIVVGSGPERVIKAAELFNQGLSKKIAIGSGYQAPEIYQNFPPGFVWLDNSSQIIAALESLGISKKKFVTIDTSDGFDTAGELAHIARYARNHDWNSIILVTSPSHSRRTDIIWKRIAPDISHFIVLAGEPGFSQWWRDSRYPPRVMYEYFALLKEVLRQILGSSEPAVIVSNKIKS